MSETYFVQNSGKKSSPFAAALIGLVFFFGSFVVIYKNEGRINLADFAQKAVQLTTGDSYADGQLVAVTGKVTTDEETGDGLFKKPEKYISLEREVEMYAWNESSHERDGGTEYTYDTDWTSFPDDSSSFEIQNGHKNPDLPFESQTFTPAKLTIDGVAVQGQNISLPGHTQAIELSSQNVTLNDKYGKAIVAEDGSEIYITTTVGVTDKSPHVGDIRVHYKAIPLDSVVTVFGAYSLKNGAQAVVPYTATKALKGSTTLYDMRYGDKDTATATLGSEFKTMLWIFRALGFLLMLIGLSMILSPLTSLLGFIPVLGQIGKFMIGVVVFLTVVVLYAVTLLISMVVHNVVAIVVAAVVVLALAGFIIKRLGTKGQAVVAGDPVSAQPNQAPVNPIPPVVPPQA